MHGVAGAVDLHIQQSGDYPQFNVDVDRTKAQLVGLTEQSVASNMLVSLSGSFQTAPSFWVDPKTGTQYQVATQTPQYRLQSLNDLGNTPLERRAPAAPHTFSRTSPASTAASAPAVVSHYNATPAIDIFGSVQGHRIWAMFPHRSTRSWIRRKKDLPKGSKHGAARPDRRP